MLRTKVFPLNGRVGRVKLKIKEVGKYEWPSSHLCKKEEWNHEEG